jgi:hypothetical protein
LAEVLELHFSEAAFLHHLRWQAPSMPDHPWEQAAIVEQRMECHLDALLLAGREGFDRFADRLVAEGEPGQAFVAALLALRLGDIGPKEALVEALAGQALEREALIDALRWEVGPAVDAWVIDLLEDPRPAACLAAVRAATQRPALLPRIAKLAEHPAPLVSLEAQRTLTFLSPGVGSPKTKPLLDASFPEAAALALEVLLRRGDTWSAVTFCQALDPAAEPSLQALALDVLAIAGPPGASGVIAGRVARAPALAVQGWIALGLCGERAGLVAMLDRLKGDWEPQQWQELEALFQAASLLTGASIEPALDLDELRPGDLDGMRTRARQAWEPMLARAQDGRRYRRGEEITPAVLARDLVGPGHPRRDLCALELAARFRCPVPFEPRARYAVQSAAAQAIARWADSGK